MRNQDIVLVIVAYDISDDKKRQTVVKIVEEFGERVQYSVFECILNKKGLAQLKRALNSISLTEEESIIIYTVKNSKYLEKWRRKSKQEFDKYEIL